MGYCPSIPLPFGDIGPCEVTWNYGSEDEDRPEVIITPHLGKVTLRMADAITDVHIDGQGVAPIESFFEGTTVELEVPMARSHLSQLANTIGYRDLGTLSGNVLTLHNVAGIEMYAQAKQIVIKPTCNNIPEAESKHWILLLKCHPYRDFELGFDRNGQRVHMVKFKVFPSQEEGHEGEYLSEGVVVPPAHDFLVTSDNKYLDYYTYADVEETRVIEVTEGGYTGDELAVEIQNKMNADGSPYTWQVTYGAGTHKFTITHTMWWPFKLLWKTGLHGSDGDDHHIGTLIGFDDLADDTGTNTYTSDNAVP